MGNLKQLAGQTAIYGVSNILSRFLNYLLVPLYTYKLATGAYGVVTEMYAYVSFLIVVLTYGMETAYFRFLNKEKENKKVYSTTLISIIVSSILFVLLTSAFSPQIAGWIQHASNSEYILWFGLIISFDAISSIPFAYLRAQNKPKRFALIKVLNILLNLFLNVFFIVICPYLLSKNIMPDLVSFFYGGHISVKYIFISNLISSGITLLFLIPELKEIRAGFDKHLWKRMVIYALPLLIFGLAGIVNETFDRILLKYLLPQNISMSQVGIYGACYKISILMTIFIQAYKYAAEPFFFSKHKELDAKQTYADMMNYFIIVTSFIFLGTMMYMKDIIIYFIGPDYRIGAPVIPILLLANLFLGVFYNLSIWYKLTDQTMFGAWLSIFGAVLTLILNFIWIPKFGYMGSAWATFFCYFAMMMASYRVGQKHYPIDYKLKKFFGYLGLSVALYFFTVWLDMQIAWQRLSLHTFFVVLFLITVYIFEGKIIKKSYAS